MPYATVAGLRLFYDTSGEGEPLLLIPGLGADHHLFDLQRQALAEHHRLILVDNRDAGASGEAAAPYGTVEMAQDAIAVLDQVAGGERFHVLGVSMGGAIAQHVALQAPDRVASLVLVSAWGRTDAFLHAVFEGWRLMISRLTPEQFLAAQAPWVFSPRFLAAPSPDVVTLQAGVRARGWPRSEAAFERQALACLGHDALSVLAILQTPTLVLAGEDDILTPPRYGRALAASLGRAELGLLTGVGHACLLESPKPFTERVLRFLARHGQSRGQAA
jgi:pimeloyl-ACP methyl ester carboxylesterase